MNIERVHCKVRYGYSFGEKTTQIKVSDWWDWKGNDFFQCLVGHGNKTHPLPSY